MFSMFAFHNARSNQEHPNLAFVPVYCSRTDPQINAWRKEIACFFLINFNIKSVHFWTNFELAKGVPHNGGGKWPFCRVLHHFASKRDPPTTWDVQMPWGIQF